MVAPLLANWAKLKLVVGLWEGEGVPYLGGFVVGAPAVQVRSTSCTEHAAPPLHWLVAIRAMSFGVFKAESRCMC